MSKEYAWATETPDDIVARWTSDAPDAPCYDSPLQVVEAFQKKLLTATISHEAQLYLGQLHPWYLTAPFRNIPEAAKPFIVSALGHHFNGKDETGGTIFPVDQVRFAGDWILMFGDLDRADEITPWPWREPHLL